MARNPEGKCASSWGSQCAHTSPGVDSHLSSADRRFVAELNNLWWRIDRQQAGPEECERFGLDVFGQPLWEWLPKPQRVWTSSESAHNYCAAIRLHTGELKPAMEAM